MDIQKHLIIIFYVRKANNLVYLKNNRLYNYVEVNKNVLNYLLILQMCTRMFKMCSTEKTIYLYFFEYSVILVLNGFSRGLSKSKLDKGGTLMALGCFNLN